MMRHYQKFQADVLDGDPAAIEIDRLLKEAGVRVLAHEKPYTSLAPHETFALDTIKRLHASYGTRVVVAGLQCLVASSHQGELRADTIRAVVEIVRAFPEWVADAKRFSKALSEIEFHKLRERARFHDCKRWAALMMLLTERLAVALGPGGGR